MIKWLKTIFDSENSERRDGENKLNNYQPTIVQVDVSEIKKQKETRKAVDNQLKHAHQFAMVAHREGCHVLHPTDASKDCRDPNCFQDIKDTVVGPAYTVSGRQQFQSTKRSLEIDATINDDFTFPDKFQQKKPENKT